MVNGRNKGAAFERDLAKILFDELGLTFKRDIEQYREADHGDLICVDMPDFPFSIEAKRYRAGYGIQPQWWSQTCDSAMATNKLPLLVYKYDRLPIRWRFPVAAIVGMSDFVPAGDTSEQYDWRYAVECDQMTAMMIIREHLADVG